MMQKVYFRVTSLFQERRHGHVSRDSELNMDAVLFVLAYARLSESRDMARIKLACSRLSGSEEDAKVTG